MLEFLNTYDIWIWLCLMVVFILIETFTFALTTIWAAIAALPLIFIALSPLPFYWQVLIFVVLTLVLVLGTRPFAVKKLKIGKYKTNIESFEGHEFIVQEKIEKFKKGKVKAENGVTWNAKASDGSEILEKEVCKVISVEGNTLVVEKIKKSEAN